MAKETNGTVSEYPKEFRRMAVQRMAECDNIGELAKELEVPVRSLYNWRARFVAR